MKNFLCSLQLPPRIFLRNQNYVHKTANALISFLYNYFHFKMWSFEYTVKMYRVRTSKKKTTDDAFDNMWIIFTYIYFWLLVCVLTHQILSKCARLNGTLTCMSFEQIDIYWNRRNEIKQNCTFVCMYVFESYPNITGSMMTSRQALSGILISSNISWELVSKK